VSEMDTKAIKQHGINGENFLMAGVTVGVVILVGLCGSVIEAGRLVVWLIKLLFGG
jgi:hypothetical protein